MRITLLILMFCTIFSCRTVYVTSGIESETNRRYFKVYNFRGIGILSVGVIKNHDLQPLVSKWEWEVSINSLESETLNGMTIYYGEPIVGKYKIYYSKIKPNPLLPGVKYIFYLNTGSAIIMAEPLEFVQ